MSSRFSRWHLALLVIFAVGARGATAAAALPKVAAPTPPEALAFARTAEGAFVTVGPAARTSTTIDRAGASIAATNAEWKMGLHLARVGRGEKSVALGATEVTLHDDRVEIAWGAGVTEWFAKRSAGVEQGFELTTKPAGTGTLALEIAVDGLEPVMSRDGRSVELRDARGAAVLRYEDLAVKDADGRPVPARLKVAERAIVIDVDDTAARWPLSVDPLVADVVSAVLTDPTAPSYEGFGKAVAIDGDTLVVGAPSRTIAGDASEGVAFVSTRVGSTWSSPAMIVAPDGAAGDGFGCAVAVRGATAVVGACTKTIGGVGGAGAVYVFHRIGSTWTPYGAPIVEASPGYYDELGFSLALDGDTLIVGAISSGIAEVFVDDGSSFKLQGSLTVPNGKQGSFGQSIALVGDDAVIGAPFLPVSTTGSTGTAYLFHRTGTAWNQVQILTATEAGPRDEFGWSVAWDGTTMAIGAPSDFGPIGSQGSTYVFLADGSGAWKESTRLLPPASVRYFGAAVAVAGASVVVGSPAENTNAGAAYLFDASDWAHPMKLPDAVTPTASLGVGAAVAIRGTTAVVGAPSTASSTASSFAAVYVPTRPNGDACAFDADCASGHCAGSVCCDRACADVCFSCSAKLNGGSDGTCAAIVGAVNEPCDAPSCKGTVLTQAVCDGHGACLPTVKDCAPGFCDASHAQGVCIPAQVPLGGACGDDANCLDGVCIGGLCCDRVCDGACESCNLPGTEGTCTTTHSGDACSAPIDAGSVCGEGGACDAARDDAPVDDAGGDDASGDDAAGSSGASSSCACVTGAGGDEGSFTVFGACAIAIAMTLGRRRRRKTDRR